MAQNRANDSQPQIFRQTIVVGIICAFVQTLGIFAPVDNWFISRITGLQAPPSRDLAPLLVTIDDATVNQFGPPPWDMLRWRQISETLKKQGIDEMTIVDPWENLININAIAVDTLPVNQKSSKTTRIKIPNLLRELPGSEGLPTQQDEPPITTPFERWDHQMYLPPDQNGVVQDFSDRSNAGQLFGPSVFCAWSHCPSGAPMALPIRPLDPELSLPMISLRRLMVDSPVLSKQDLDRTIILGITAQWRSQLMRLGVESQLTHWPLAVSAVISTSKQHEPTGNLGLIGNIVILFVCIGLGTVVVRITQRYQVSIFVILLPLTMAMVSSLCIYNNVIHLPSFGMMITAGIPPLISALEGRRLAMEFMRRVALLVVEDSFRYGWKSTRVQTHEELFIKLAALTRAQTPGSTLAYLAVNFNDQSIHYIGGYGIDREAFSPTLKMSISPFKNLKNSSVPIRADQYLERPSTIAPIRQGTLTIGFWVIGATSESHLPDSDEIMRLTRWLSRHLQIEGVPTKQSIQEWLFDHLEAESVAVQELFLMASEERRRQIRTLHTIQIPLMTADIAGSTLFINAAFKEFLERNTIDNIRSIRELIFRLFGEDELQKQMDTLFLNRKPISQDLTDFTGKPWKLTVQSVYEDGLSHADRILGFVAFLTDATDSNSLNTIQNALSDVRSTQVREALTYVSEHAQWLESKTSRPAAQAMLRNFSTQAQTAFRALDAIELSEGDPRSQTIQADIQEMVQHSIQEISGIAKSRNVTLDVVWPTSNQMVWVDPKEIGSVFESLLRHGVRSAPHGTTLKIHQFSTDTTVSFRWSWEGAGLDTFFVKQAQESWDKHDNVPDIIQPYVNARRTFADLKLSSKPGQGVQLSFSLPRTGGGA